MKSPTDDRPNGFIRPGRTRVLALTFALAVVVAGGLLWRIQWSGRGSSGERPANDMADMAGMDMSQAGSARLSPAQVRQFGVTFGTVEVRQLDETVRAVGYVTVDESRVVDVAPRFGGFAERMHVATTGAPVRGGDPLVTAYSPELLAAQQELLVARALERGTGGVRIPGIPERPLELEGAARERLVLLGMRASEIDSVVATAAPLRTVTVVAPASGVVLSKHVVEGTAFSSGQLLYRIADLSTIWIDAELRGADAARVQRGASAAIAIEGLAGRQFAGRVDYVYPTLDAASRTVRARIVVPNPSATLKPGMFATVSLHMRGRSALTVPSTAVVRTGARTLVFVDFGSGEFAARAVELGAERGELTEVLAGLEPGQRVVTSAQFLLDSESNLGDVMRSMMSQMGMSDMGGR